MRLSQAGRRYAPVTTAYAGIQNGKGTGVSVTQESPFIPCPKSKDPSAHHQTCFNLVGDIWQRPFLSLLPMDSRPRFHEGRLCAGMTVLPAVRRTPPKLKLSLCGWRVT